MALASILQLILIFGLENIVLVQRSPYPVLNLSLPSFSRKKPPPPCSVAQTPALRLSQPPTPGSQALAGLEWLEESWGCLWEVCL